MSTGFKKISALFFSTVVLLASTSFTTQMHFCCGNLISIAIDKEAQPCSEKVHEVDHACNKCTIESRDCCADKSILKSGNSAILSDTIEPGISSLIFLNAFYSSYLIIIEGLDRNAVPFEGYRPPLILKDILVLHEVFLI